MKAKRQVTGNESSYVRTVSVNGNALRRIRKENGFTQADLAALARICVRTVRSMERGVALPRTVKLVADRLQVPIKSLLLKQEEARHVDDVSGPVVRGVLLGAVFDLDFFKTDECTELVQNLNGLLAASKVKHKVFIRYVGPDGSIVVQLDVHKDDVAAIITAFNDQKLFAFHVESVFAWQTTTAVPQPSTECRPNTGVTITIGSEVIPISSEQLNQIKHLLSKRGQRT